MTSTGSASSAATSDPTNATAGSSASDSSSSGGGGGVSTKILALAVTIPVVVLLLVFGLVIWLGIRRGWFVRKSQRGGRAEEGEKGDAVTEAGAGKSMGGNTGEPAFLSVRELHADDLPHQLGGSGVHELHGGEGGRQFGGQS